MNDCANFISAVYYKTKKEKGGKKEKLFCLMIWFIAIQKPPALCRGFVVRFRRVYPAG